MHPTLRVNRAYRLEGRVRFGRRCAHPGIACRGNMATRGCRLYATWRNSSAVSMFLLDRTSAQASVLRLCASYQRAVKHPSIPNFQVPSPILVVRYTGRFIRSIVCRACRERPQQRYSAGADASRRENGVAVPQAASARGVFYTTWTRDSPSFWEQASCADRPIACDGAKRCSRSPPRRGRRPDAASPPQVRE